MYLLEEFLHRALHLESALALPAILLPSLPLSGIFVLLSLSLLYPYLSLFLFYLLSYFIFSVSVPLFPLSLFSFSLPSSPFSSSHLSFHLSLLSLLSLYLSSPSPSCHPTLLLTLLLPLPPPQCIPDADAGVKCQGEPSASRPLLLIPQRSLVHRCPLFPPCLRSSVSSGSPSFPFPFHFPYFFSLS